MQKQLNQLYEWCKENRNTANTMKTKHMITSRWTKEKPKQIIKLSFNNEGIAGYKCINSLGACLDDRLE